MRASLGGLFDSTNGSPIMPVLVAYASRHWSWPLWRLEAPVPVESKS